jgi:hypothetical protein
MGTATPEKGTRIFFCAPLGRRTKGGARELMKNEAKITQEFTINQTQEASFLEELPKKDAPREAPEPCVEIMERTFLQDAIKFAPTQQRTYFVKR